MQTAQRSPRTVIADRAVGADRSRLALSLSLSKSHWPLRHGPLPPSADRQGPPSGRRRPALACPKCSQRMPLLWPSEGAPVL